MAGIYIQRDNRRCIVIKHVQPNIGRETGREGREGDKRKEKKQRKD